MENTICKVKHGKTLKWKFNSSVIGVIEVCTIEYIIKMTNSYSENIFYNLAHNT